MKPVLDSKIDYNAISIFSVAQRCNVKILKLGHHQVAHCPFHGQDNTPSLIFYPSTNSWTCFGKCEGKNGHKNGGGPVQFVMQYFHYDYHDAIKWLKKNFTLFEPVVVESKKENIAKVVPHPWVLYWHSMMEEEHKQYYHERGFSDEFINREMWGWDGQRFTLPVWEGEPGNSDVLGVRRRIKNGNEGMKYLGLKDMNPPTVWGRWYCQTASTVFAFAGEFDAALANQDGYPSFSVVNGVEALADFPSNWPQLWFPKCQHMVAVFDRKEESFGGRLCQAWNKTKGSMMARVFHWPPGEYKDYSEFRKAHGKDEFKLLILKEGLLIASDL